MDKNVEKRKIIHRLKTIKGHIKGIENMIENDKGCKEVLNQLSAIESSIKGVSKIVIKNYAKEAVHNDATIEEIEDVLNIMFKYIT